MLKRITPKEIEENWDKYKANIKKAFEATEGGTLIMSDSKKDFYSYIYNRLVNPFQNSMTLWVEGEENYVVLTQLQKCSFTGKKTLVINSCTRTKDVDKETVAERYLDMFKTLSKFAVHNKCVGMYMYSDLDYYAKRVEETRELTNAVTRYQFYFPLK